VIPLQSAKVYKRYSSVIPSAHILTEMEEVQPGMDRTQLSALDRLNGVQPASAASPEVQRSTLVFGRPNLPHSASSSSMVPKVQLRTQRSRLASRPISMPLERLPAPARSADRSSRIVNANASAGPTERVPGADTIQETTEPEKPPSSRVSTYYITPFIDTQTMQRRTWDRKYKHYDVTPRTAMIMANLPSASAAVQAAGPSGARALATPALPGVSGAGGGGTISTAFPIDTHAASVKRTSATDGAPGAPITLRAPRTLQPPPETFYKPPVATGNRARTLPHWTTATVTTVTTSADPTASASASSTSSSSSPPPPTTPSEGSGAPLPSLSRLRSVDSGEGSGDSEASPFEPLSPPPSSPDDLSPGEVKPVYQRLRPRRLQEMEHREAHFV